MRPAAAIAAAALLLTACDPITGSGTGDVPDAHRFLLVDATSRSAVLTLVAGYPASSLQFNFNGYANGDLKITVPVGWTLDVQCQNRGTVPNSCAIVAGARATDPVRPDWSTPDPHNGLPAGASASFEVVPDTTASYRITSLVPGREPAGMWAVLTVAADGTPSITGTASS